MHAWVAFVRIYVQNKSKIKGVRLWGIRVTLEIEPNAGIASLDAASNGPAIVAEIVQVFTFASHQNSVPVIRSLRIDNASDEQLENVTLEMTASPSFLRNKTWKIDRILARESIELSDRRIELDAKYLGGLDEAELGDIKFRINRGGLTLGEKTFQVRLLARDEWGGVADMAQLLPAFVMPNDPAVSGVLLQAANYLEQFGHASALDGYQRNDPKRVFIITAAIYSAVAKLDAFYAQPPASFERRGQKIRGPSRIKEERLATCLDTTNLFAAALEGAGLNPVILIFEGHAAVGVWLSKRSLPNTVENDATELRKAIASRELIVFETTGITQRPVMMFQHAKELCESRLAENFRGMEGFFDFKSQPTRPDRSRVPCGSRCHAKPRCCRGSISFGGAGLRARCPDRVGDWHRHVQGSNRRA